MPDVLELAVDRLKRAEREDFFLAILTYAGPPPKEGGYTAWCHTVERGAMLLYPHWGTVDRLDATVQFRHWCCRRGIKQRRIEAVNRLCDSILKTVRRML